MIEVTQPLLNSTDESGLEQKSLNEAIEGETYSLKSVVNVSSWCLAWILIFLEISGLLFNIVVLDLTTNFKDKVGGSRWMSYLAIWDFLFVALHFFIDIFRTVTGSDFRERSNFGCKTVQYLFVVAVANSSAHLVMMAVDRYVKAGFLRKGSVLLSLTRIEV